MADNLKQVAIEAAKSAGEVILRMAKSDVRYQMKNAHDILADADVKSEGIIISTIRKYFSDHDILSEEAGQENRKSDYLWVVDPIDGTINFARGIEEYCISIALSHQGTIILGIIYQPQLKKMYVAEKGKGAKLNGKLLAVSKEENLVNGLLATDLTSDIQKRESTFQTLITLKDKVRHVRIFGSSALHLARLAEGQLDVYFKNRFRYWDYAAGMILVEEAGGKVTDFQGNPVTQNTTDILVTNGPLQSEMLNFLQT